MSHVCCRRSPRVPPQAQGTVRGHPGVGPAFEGHPRIRLLSGAGRHRLPSGISGAALPVPGQQQGRRRPHMSAGLGDNVRPQRHLTAARLPRSMRHHLQTDTRL